MSPAATTINFTLNGRPVAADVKPHHNVVEMLQTQFALFGARESCGQGLVRLLHRVGGRAAGVRAVFISRFSSTVPKVITVEHLATRASLIQCSRRSSNAEPSSAAIAHPAS